MKNGLALIAFALIVAVGLHFSHNEKGTLLAKSICVAPIQNLSHKAMAMDGVDDEFVAQLHKIGFESRKTSAGTSHCDATTNAEVVDVSGRGRKTARVDFRLMLTSEQVPRLSSSVEGMSGDSLATDFAETPRAEREAIVAALKKTASQIDAAYRRGLAGR
jgi:hypothetical protein